MPNYGYHLARARGASVRQFYRAFLPTIARRALRSTASLPINVFAYSGESALPEQVASIRSFLTFAGRPLKFTVVSDGTYSARSLELLRRIDPVVATSAVREFIPNGLSPKITAYLASHPTGKQLALIMSLPTDAPALYVDSDVLFFAGASEFARLALTRDVSAFYMEDCRFSGDERLLRAKAEERQPVNTGMLMLFRQLDWRAGLERFEQLTEAPTFFTNQTMTHLAMHANGAQPFDIRRFVLQLDDQFVYEDRYAGPSIALRHYVNPVRHKFWTSLC